MFGYELPAVPQGYARPNTNITFLLHLMTPSIILMSKSLSFKVPKVLVFTTVKLPIKQFTLQIKLLQEHKFAAETFLLATCLWKTGQSKGLGSRQNSIVFWLSLSSTSWLLTLHTLCHAPTIMLTATVKITLKDMTKLGTEGVCSCVTIITITVIGKQNVSFLISNFHRAMNIDILVLGFYTVCRLT